MWFENYNIFNFFTFFLKRLKIRYDWTLHTTETWNSLVTYKDDNPVMLFVIVFRLILDTKHVENNFEWSIEIVIIVHIFI